MLPVAWLRSPLTIKQCNMVFTSGLLMTPYLPIIGEAEATLIGRIVSDSPGGSTGGEVWCLRLPGWVWDDDVRRRCIRAVKPGVSSAWNNGRRGKETEWLTATSERPLQSVGLGELACTSGIARKPLRPSHFVHVPVNCYSQPITVTGFPAFCSLCSYFTATQKKYRQLMISSTNSTKLHFVPS